MNIRRSHDVTGFSAATGPDAYADGRDDCLRRNRGQLRLVQQRVRPEAGRGASWPVDLPDAVRRVERPPAGQPRDAGKPELRPPP